MLRWRPKFKSVRLFLFLSSTGILYLFFNFCQKWHSEYFFRNYDKLLPMNSATRAKMVINLPITVLEILHCTTFCRPQRMFGGPLNLPHILLLYCTVQWYCNTCVSVQFQILRKCIIYIKEAAPENWAKWTNDQKTNFQMLIRLLVKLTCIIR